VPVVSEEDVPTPGFPQRHHLAWMRVGVLAVCTAIVAASSSSRGSIGSSATALIALALVAVAANVPLPSPRAQRYQPVAEAVLAATIVLTVEPLQEGLLPYLLAPAFVAGITFGAGIASVTVGAALFVLLAGRLFTQSSEPVSEYVGTVSEWCLIALAVGLLAAWVRRLQTDGRSEPETNAAYAAAYRLIAQLRLVSRQLAGGLDAVSLAGALLQSLATTVGYDRAAVFTRSPGGRLVPIAVEGGTRVEWDTRTDEGTPFAEAWAAAEPLVLGQALTPGQPGVAAIIPLKIGVRTFGLVGMERSAPPYDVPTLRRAAQVVAESALRLETALLFDEVRSIATAEERRRLAREIHDGIAQELASLGYEVDELASRARYLPELESSLRSLRSEVSRIISDLRLSIFDLRSDVEASIGLGTALSDHVRQVGLGSNFTVHLVLDESPTRLPIQTEAELLRIAQEAITNARKHAGAENLWVTCRVDPPGATIMVEDDGSGLGSRRTDSFGMEIMRERAARIGARIDVRNREPAGTVVQVDLG